MDGGDSYNRLALPAGTRLRDYVVEKTLGAGGFGITYLARHEHLGQCAIKEYMPNEYAVRVGAEVFPKTESDEKDYEQGLARFLREARALKEFRDAHIVGVNDFFKENNTAYMVLHYEEGKTLEQMLVARETLIPEKELLSIVRPLLDTMERMHNAGLVHRDIAPDNIILRPGLGPVLIDFGAARHAIGGRSKSFSRTVKDGYSPPEQHSGAGQEIYTDIYALSATLYRAMTGIKPPNGWVRAIEITMGNEDPLKPVTPGIYSENLTRAVTAGLAIKPEQRPATIKKWREILEADAAIGISDNERAAVKKRGSTGVAHESELRDFLRDKGVSADSENSYVSYLHSVSHGLGVHITPELVAARTNDEILEEVGRHPTRAGGLPSARSLNNWRSALNRYREMCEARNVAPEQTPVTDKPHRRETNRTPKQGGGVWGLGAFLFVIAAVVGVLLYAPNASEEAYQEAMQADTIEDWVAFLEGPYGSGVYADEARQRATVLANRMNEKGEPPLLVASEKGDYNAVTLLIAAGASVNVGAKGKRYAGYTPLHWAARQGRLDIMKVLFTARAVPNLKSEQKKHTPLHLAAWNGHADAVSILIKSGSDVNAPNYKGATPLHSATQVKQHSVSIMKMLLDKGAEINACSREGTPPRTALWLIMNIEKLRNPKAEQFLRKRGAREFC